MKPRQKQINHQLKKLGFGGLDDPQLLHQMGFCIRDHEHFRKVLLAVETGEQRKIAYDAMRPHLNFPANPLDWYIMEGQREAEELQLPIKNPDGSFTAYRDYHGAKPTLEVQAEKAIREAQHEKALQLTCHKCTVVGIFPALDKLAAYAYAKKSGWVFEDWDGKEISICPDCPAIRSVVANA